MNRRRRIAIVAVSVLASLAGSVAVGHALPGTPNIERGATGGENSHGDWWCVHTDTLELTYCQGDPLPERLPVPDRPAV